MNRRQRIRLAAGVVVLAVLAGAGGGAYVLLHKPSHASPVNSVSTMLPEGDGKQQGSRLSAHFADWNQWNNQTRLKEVTALGKQPIPKDVADLFLTQIQNRELGQHLRNNMAESLLVNRRPEMRLTQLFYEMMHDPAEYENWRIYALQFFARSAEGAKDDEKQFITEELLRLVKGENAIMSGTAIDMLVFLTESGRCLQPPQGFCEQLHLMLRDPKTPQPVLLVVQNALLRYQYAPALPEYRKNAVEGPVLLRLGALAALGEMGAATDKEIIRKSLNHEDKRIAIAADAALTTYEKRGGQPKNVMPPAAMAARRAVEAQQEIHAKDGAVLQRFMRAQNAENTRDIVVMPRKN